jgi:hypothetical protein
MTKMLFATFISILCLCACNKDDDNTIPANTQTEIAFTGEWERQFEAGSGNLHTVSYSIYQDSMRYTLEGPIGQADYVMLRDTFLLENNRYVGHTPTGQYYLVLVKDVSEASISVYKQLVEDLEEGMNTQVPPASTTQNHGWNVFKKK